MRDLEIHHTIEEHAILDGMMVIMDARGVRSKHGVRLARRFLFNAAAAAVVVGGGAAVRQKHFSAHLFLRFCVSRASVWYGSMNARPYR